MKILQLALYMVVCVAISVIAFPALAQDAELATGATQLPWPVSPLEWSGNINGEEVNVTGSFEDIFPHLGLGYPQIPPNDDHLANTTAVSNIKHTASGEVESALVERATTGKWNTLCIPIRGWDWQRAYVWALKVVIYNFSAVPGVCKIPAHSCKRMQCYYGSTVYVCNDSDREVRPECKYLGSFVQDIINLCSVNRENPKITRAGGQEFEIEGYNVIVKQESCGW
ncbi:hypothetical protein BKA65DRAFT_535201 [Rhexocercosporidium sp. MPI-PUGE-AT-0058]|nr:hypothetical protein BKA65DRAFT_535201 [Rhexocercosporidium sp. MPI-PUGE-AT-0058]